MALPRWSAPLALSALLAVSTLARPGGTQTPPPGEAYRPPAPLAAPAPSRVDPVPIEEAIQKLAADVQRWGGTVGVHVVDVATGAAVAGLDERRAFNPASNAKLWTAAAALRVLGGSHRFLTG